MQNQEQLLAQFLKETSPEFEVWLKNNNKTVTLPDGTVFPLPKPRDNNLLVWFINVMEIGGTALWALEAIKSLPDFSHVLFYFGPGENLFVLKQFNELGVKTLQVDNITREALADFSPVAVILSNTDPNRIEGGWPWDWITKEYPVFYVHHSAVSPWLPGSVADIFVSDYLRAKYSNLLNHCKETPIIPPGIDTTPFTSIPLDKKNGKFVIGRYSNNNPQKFSDELMEINSSFVAAEYVVVGGGQFFDPRPGYSFPRIGSKPVIEWLSEWDVFVYCSRLPETWGRCVTEALAAGLPVISFDLGDGVSYQIKESKGGILVNSVEECQRAVDDLRKNRQKRLTMGANGRKWARENADISAFGRYVRDKIHHYLRNS